MGNRSDNFNRGDSVLSINSPSDGGSDWTIPTATAIWGISSNQGYPVASVSQDICVLESLLSDVDVQLTLATKGSDPGLIARETDDNNYLLVTFAGGSGPNIFRRQAGGFISILSFSMTYADGDTYRLNLNGTALNFYQNAGLKGTASSSFNQTATKHGIRTSSDTTPRFDDFSITGLGGASVAPWARRFSRVGGAGPHVS